MMSAEENKARLQRLFAEGVNRGDLDVLDEVLSPTYVNYNLPAPTPGSDGFKQVVTMFRTAFPDLAVTVEEVIAEGDKVATRGSWRGTHHGEFMGIPQRAGR
jgi:predicted ester cyclase